MQKRQRIILRTLHLMQSPRNPLKVMKLAFLLKQETRIGSDKGFYDFFPYHYGAYSVILQRDLNKLECDGFLDCDDNSIDIAPGCDTGEVFEGLDRETCLSVESIVALYGSLSTEELLHLVYSRYPDTTVRSKITKAAGARVCARTAIYTSGYEGESIDHFLNKLTAAGIHRLIDVRYNALSRKYGFSKNGLRNWCERLGIEYLHYRELGIPPEYRRELSSYEDYRNLLDDYERSILPGAADFKSKVTRLLQEKPTSLFCFEADVKCCHRGRLAESISADTGMEIIHI